MTLPDVISVFRRALVVCAHTDDEFGCAGAVMRLVEAGAEVRYVAFSRCEESVPTGFPRDVLEKECRECCARMGLKAELVQVGLHPVRHFPAHRQAILEELVALRGRYQPDLVLVPASGDMHQDHGTVYAESFRAFKSASILGYELPQNLTSFQNTAFVRLTPEHLARKVESLAAYVSQGFRPYAAEEFVRSLAVIRGVQAGARYAEAFEAIRLHL